MMKKQQKIFKKIKDVISYVSEGLNVEWKTKNNTNIRLTSDIKIHHGLFAPVLRAAPLSSAVFKRCALSICHAIQPSASPRRRLQRHYLIVHAAQALRLILEFSFKRLARKRQLYDF